MAFKKLKFLTLGILIIIPLIGNAQKEFPEDHEDFCSKFCNTFDRIKLDGKRAGKHLAEDFEKFWFSDTLSIEEKDKFIETANLLYMKGAEDFPNFFIYAENMMLFYRKGFKSAQYENWHEGLEKILKEKKYVNTKNISQYQFIANDLLRDTVVARHPRIYWKVSNFPDDIGYNEKGLYMKFTNVNLFGFHNYDTIKIFKTSAIVYPQSDEWKGQYGRVDWRRVNLSSDSVYADLKKYNIDLTETDYEADSAKFVNLNYFKEPLLGVFKDEAGNLDDPSKSNYPRFKSYTKKFLIEDIFKGIDYEGGFHMKGNRFIGSGVKKQKAKIIVEKSDSIYFVASSKTFVLDPEEIHTNEAEVIIHMSGDSIYHPGLRMRYKLKARLLSLQREGEGMSRVYFTNSYHKLHMDFTWLQWNIDKYKMHFGMLKSMSGVNEAVFESSDYFSEKKYKKLRVRDQVHPFRRLENYSKKRDTSAFHLTDFARDIGYSPYQVRQMVLRLAYRGFVNYDTDNGLIRIKPELFNYLKFRRGVKDYDAIIFGSRTKERGSNATLSLLNYDLEINGVPSIHLSDSQKVRVNPIDGKVIMKKNRDFVFNGWMRASQFFFYGSEFKFDYDNFMIDLEQCDSMKMLVETGDYMADGGKILRKVKNTIENIKGKFYIDGPSNKSGLEDMPQYPKFISEKESYVYYDDKSIYNGVYPRHTFFFKIDPYEVDSLHGYSQDNIQFDGTFYSADIFPDIEETLVVRPDYSLGFHRKTPSGGYPAYRGKGRYTNEIDLSNLGLRGAGKLEYSTSTTKTDSVIFFPDSLIAHAETFNLPAQTSPVKYPSVEGENNDVTWYPYQDEYNVSTIDNKFVMFENRSTMKGTLTLTPSQLKGKGEMDIERSKVYSEMFTYKREYIDADTSDFELYNKGKELDIDFSTENVNTHIDFPNRKGHFKTNGEGSYVSFPKNQYIGYMEELVWHMDKNFIQIESDSEVLDKIKDDQDMTDEEWEDLFLEGPKFISVHPEQDSLKFVAPTAKYDLDNHIITAEGVKLIRVADATIYTEDGKVVVEKEAVMRPIKNARIVANTTNRYHEIINSTVNIYGKNQYTAYGDYEYEDKAGQIQKFHFKRVGVDGTGQTFAEGEIPVTDDFELSPNFKYQGDVELSANKKNLTFDGAVKLKQKCKNINTSWLKFRSEIDPEYVAIPVDSTPMSINNDPLAAGLIIHRDSVYTAMYSSKRRHTDEHLFMADGYLIFDNKDRSYKISNKAKLEEESLPGNLLRLGRIDCTINGYGAFSFSDEFGLFKPNPIGKFVKKPDNDTVSLDIVMLMDFMFNKNALEIMAEDINKASGLTGTDLGSDIYEQAILEYLGQEKAEKWFSELSMGNLRKAPDEMKELKVLTDVHMKYYPSESMFIHEGPVGVSTLGDINVNRNVFSFIALEKNRRGDTFHMYIEIDADTWYYFRYNSGNMAALSSNKEFNMTVYDTKPAKRIIKPKGDRPSYRYSMGSSSYKRRFVDDMNELFGYEDEE